MEKRINLDLNGIWQAEESMEADAMPSSYGHTVKTPGFISFAEPAFVDAGLFATRDYQWNNVVINNSNPHGTPVPVDKEAMDDPIGISRQTRNYFWYRRTFTAPAAKEHAMLLVRKAQFGSKIWVNGEVVGERTSCMTAGKYDISPVIRWNSENEIIIRVGAHPGVLPKEVVVNQDFEKEYWMPGLWDDVELSCFDGPAIYAVQTGTRIDPKKIIARTTLKNTDAAEKTVVLKQTVKAKDGSILANAEERVTVPANGEAVSTTELPVPDAELWCPEHPALCDLVTETDGDCVFTKVGVREFRFDTPTRSAYLNGKKIFLRGGLIAFGRLTEDSTCGDLPWDYDWARRAIAAKPREMHWNCLKLCIHAVPDKWLQIADEEGMLMFAEFPIWTLTPKFFVGYTKPWLHPEHVKPEMTDWVLDHTNHPCILYYNSCLETYNTWMTDVVKEVRKLDLNDRPWSNSWMPPVGPDDPVEDHQYEYGVTGMPKEYGIPNFKLQELEKKAGCEVQSHGDMPSSHPVVLTEYGWLFMGRDGEPSPLSRRVWNVLAEEYPAATADERFRTHAYIHAGLTEYWRAFRHLAGIIQISYLSWNDSRKCSCGYMSDLKNLEFNPYFEEYVKDAFNPMGVYLNYWHPVLKYGEDPNPYVVKYGDPDVQILWTMICNDDQDTKFGEIVITLENAEETFELARTSFEVAPAGQTTVRTDVKVPHVSGKWTLKATAIRPDGETVTSQRWVEVKSRG